jgi:hypothetical protein
MLHDDENHQASQLDSSRKKFPKFKRRHVNLQYDSRILAILVSDPAVFVREIAQTL